jgi:hypothetical protein
MVFNPDFLFADVQPISRFEQLPLVRRLVAQRAEVLAKMLAVVSSIGSAAAKLRNHKRLSRANPRGSIDHCGGTASCVARP